MNRDSRADRIDGVAAILRKSGIRFVGEIPWGAHLCHFFETKEDLLDMLIPYFRAGLEAGELCLWVVAPPLTVEEAKAALRRAVPDLDRYLLDRCLEVHPHSEWYLSAGAMDLARVTRAWEEKLDLALKAGFSGLRVNGSAAWVREEEWRDFSEYEERIHESIGGKQMIVLCTYPLADSEAARLLDVARTHEFAVAKRNGRWDIVETPRFHEAKEEIQRRSDELQERVGERTSELEAVNAKLRARNRQQSVVAALGQAAIRAHDLGALMNEAVAVAAATLGTEHGSVLELLPNGEELLVRAGVGWEDGVVGWNRVPTLAGSTGGFILRSDAPVVIRDLREETRFVPSPLLLARGVRSMMGVVVRGRAHPWGMLVVHADAPRMFSADDAGFLQSVANVLALSIERYEVEVARRREKETLQAIFDNIPLMISSYDAAGGLLRVNREWERTLGWTFEEAQSVDILGECYPDPESRREALEFVRRADRQWTDFRTRARDGRVLDTSWARVQLSDGSRLGFGLDLTDRKRAEEERGHLLESERAARTEAESALERLRAIESITDGALRHLGLDELLRELLARLQRALATDSATVLLVSEDGETLYPRTAAGYELNPAVRVRIGSGVSGLVAATGNALIVDDYSRIDVSGIEGVPESNLRTEVSSVMGVPLRILDEVVGVVLVSSQRARRFTAEELVLMGLVADRAAPAVERARLLEKLRAAGELQKSLSRRLLTAQEEERRSLAVELHDELGQVLGAVKINLESLERMSRDAPAPTHLQDAIASVEQAMVQVRDLALDLRPSVLDDLGLAAALRWYVSRFARGVDAEVQVSVDPVPTMEPELETACFRVAQEALTNVSRHARARHVWLILRVLPDGVELVVRDDGVGFDVGAARERAIGGTSIGLLGMQERVSLVSGEFAIRSVAGGGTEVRARFASGEKGPRPE